MDVDVEKLQEMVDPIHDEWMKVRLKIQNIDTFAGINGFRVNWSTGKVHPYKSDIHEGS